MFSAEPNATLAKTTLGIKQRAAVSARFQQLSPWARHRVLALPGTNKKVSEFTAVVWAFLEGWYDLEAPPWYAVRDDASSEVLNLSP